MCLGGGGGGVGGGGVGGGGGKLPRPRYLNPIGGGKLPRPKVSHSPPFPMRKKDRTKVNNQNYSNDLLNGQLFLKR